MYTNFSAQAPLSLCIGLLVGSLYALLFLHAKKYLYIRNPHTSSSHGARPYAFVLIFIARFIILASLLALILHSSMTSRILVLVSFLFSFWLVILKAKNGFHGKS
jgi:hypothetical protein